MKRLTVCALLAAFFCSAVSAYNPPVNGENYLELASPEKLTGASSVTGGAIYTAGPDSLLLNPALTASEQRVVLNLAGSLLWSTGVEKSKGTALQAGILIPTKMFVFGGYFNYTGASFAEMNLANSLNIKAGLSKEITDKLDVGIGLSGGLCWGNVGATALAADLGFVYNHGKLAFMDDFRYGVSLMNLGKTYGYPSPFTIKLGCAANLFKNDAINLGYSFDFTIPQFQNLITDIGLQASIKDMFIISIAEKINLEEAKNGCSTLIPSIGLSFKFDINVKNEYLEKNDWSKSEINVSAAYKPVCKDVNAASAGVTVLLGMEDTSAPFIDESVFEEEE